jgi:hypothetical protein
LPLQPGFYKVKVKSTKMWLPILPLKADPTQINTYLKNKLNLIDIKPGLFFPNGEFETFVWSEELELFLQHGGEVTEILETYIFSSPLRPVFKEFAAYSIHKALHEQPHTKLKKKLWKLILVSLYGRFGMDVKKTKTIVVNSSNYRTIKNSKTILNEYWKGSHGIIEIENYDIKGSKPQTTSANVIYAAIITAKARIKLYRAISDVIKHGGRPLYCDTDSIFAAYPNDVTDQTHGEITWTKKSLIQNCIFASTRSYSIINNQNEVETKVAGIPRNSINFEDFLKGFYQKGPAVYSIFMDKYSTFSHSRWNTKVVIDILHYDKRQFIEKRSSTKPWFKITEGFIEDPFI